MKGYALSFSSVTSSEVRETARFRERWRFEPEEEPLGDGLGPDGWEPRSSRSLSCGTWSAELLDWTHQASADVARQRGQRRPARWARTEFQVEKGPGIPVLPDRFVAAGRWQRILRGGWAHGGAIHLKEVRVCLLGLRRAARTKDPHQLTITDSLPAALSFEKGGHTTQLFAPWFPARQLIAVGARSDGDTGT